MNTINIAELPSIGFWDLKETLGFTLFPKAIAVLVLPSEPTWRDLVEQQLRIVQTWCLNSRKELSIQVNEPVMNELAKQAQQLVNSHAVRHMEVNSQEFLSCQQKAARLAVIQVILEPCCIALRREFPALERGRWDLLTGKIIVSFTAKTNRHGNTNIRIQTEVTS